MMATRPPGEPSPRPEVGDTLLVIRKLTPADRRSELLRQVLLPHLTLPCHLPAADDFVARSSDELSLKKGDKVELLERDDEFGDGWFLGKHLTSGNTGLFPEGVYIFFTQL
jgi:hypothetical protein